MGHSRLRTYLQLMRFPALFTAFADILLGVGLAVGVPWESGQAALLGKLLGLLVASGGLYLAGMVFNDVFDRHQDAAERPDRPIPSGRVSLRSAIRLGTGLLITGLLAAAVVDKLSLAVAAAVAVCVLGYDGWLKLSPLGPVLMGACRAGNVLLGVSVAGQAALLTSPPATVVAAGLGAYVAGLTWFGRREARTSPRLSLSAAAVVINLGLGILFWHVWQFDLPINQPRMVLVLAVMILIIDRRVIAAVFDPGPQTVQRAMKTLLMSLVVLDATLVFFHTADAAYACVTVALLAPTLVIGRWLSVT